MCPGCYKQESEGYCLKCRKLLFNGAKVPPMLEFDRPKAENLPEYHEKTKQLSISGVQLKYSLRLEGNRLVFADSGGQYILKPIPPTVLIAEPYQAPENEHLTMQLAALAGIETAANALIYFRDGSPAYITKRFDLRPDGGKYLQEDMAQISGRNRQTKGDHFKYDGSYEEIGSLIRRHVAAAIPVLERYFQLVLFNYLFSNGDAHMKNFSLRESSMGDYILSPAYDLMCTIIHLPGETDTALDLYEGDHENPHYARTGSFGQPSFRELAARLGLKPQRAGRIMAELLGFSSSAKELIQQSLLREDIKEKYLSVYLDKLQRMKLTGDMIGAMINPERPDVYQPTTAATRLSFTDGSFKVGYFNHLPESEELAEHNKYTFIEINNALAFRESGDKNLVSIIDGELLTDVEYPSRP